MPISSVPPPAGPAGDDAGSAGALVAAVVLAGGEARRFGGADKTAAALAGRPVLEHVVAGVRTALGADVPVVVVGPDGHPAAARPVAAGVRWVREDPPGGGPVAGLAAGLAALPDGADVVAVVAGDLPFAGPAVARATQRLLAVGPRGASCDAVVGEDPQGRPQPLLAAYRVAALRAALATGPAAGRSVRSVLAALQVVAVPVDTRESLDLDTPDDLTAASALVDQ